MQMENETLLKISQFAIFFGAVLAALGGLGTNHFKDKIDASKSETSKNDREELNGRISELLDGNKALQQSLAPFEEYAKKKFPHTSSEEALKKLEQELGKVKAVAQKAERGIYTGYDFNGARRSSRPGVMNVDVGEEYGTFQKMLKLEKEKNYIELIQLCQSQIEKTPTWLTPHLFIGLAYLNIGRKPEGISALKYVSENGAGDPNYALADQILKQLGQK
jgi:hypothetical protein